MKIALFGGAFNPLTKGHAICAKELLKHGFDKVWFVPCNVSASLKILASGKDRINMCNIVSNKIPNVETCDVEIKYNLTGTPYDIFTTILKKYKNSHTQFYFAMGLDNANSVYSWPEYEKSLNVIPYVILPRGDSLRKTEKEWYDKEPHMYLKSMPPLCISSTEFKQEYSSTGTSDLVEKDVLEYIKANKLY